MSYKICWQQENGLFVAGMKRYTSREDAEKQIAIWKSIFRSNTYMLQDWFS